MASLEGSNKALFCKKLLHVLKYHINSATHEGVFCKIKLEIKTFSLYLPKMSKKYVVSEKENSIELLQ